MSIKISDLVFPKEKLEKEYQVVQVGRWQKDGEVLGWTYECVLPKLRFEKFNVKVSSEFPVISQEELGKQGLALITFENLEISAWGRANGQFVNYGLSATAISAKLIEQK
ncbi:hypothetical protein KZR92_002217 [Enterococcus faecalis]|nr:hypothetical protein [Enterococcus faecalis]EHU8846585.1 hypothetical protein [Enterococcus faecalis]EHV2874955.1 hypothetical protein [Enterococcus faecalis]HDT7327189.1 hypothetical protein [Enterococcus faecalis]HDT7347602.1 hypothetical protein [Enterococcus faecalis]